MDEQEQHQEQIEKVRQAIMRYRELLNLMRDRLDAAERNYAALFDGLSQEQRDTLAEKALQREAAIQALTNLEPLRRAVLRIQFNSRDLERAFEELYNNIAPEA